MLSVLVYIFSICIAIQTIYTIWFLWAMGSKKVKEQNLANPEGVSVIICAKNEAANLKQYLPLILKQQHPKFELIVVNDASEDNSKEVLTQIAQQYNDLKIITIDLNEKRKFLGKKEALSKGIEAAQYENILLSDADCKPASPHWLSKMTDSLQGHVEIVAGVGDFDLQVNAINIFTNWETLHSFIQYSSYANSGIPYMAVGRNLAVKKSLILAAQKDERWNKTASGDDDLFIQICANKHNIAVQSDPESFTISQSKRTLQEYIAQKKRHLSTGKLYKKHQQILLSIYAASHGLMWLLFILLSFSGHFAIVGTVMLLRCILSYILWSIAAFQFRKMKLIPFFLFADIAWAFYNLFLSPYILFKTKKQWT